MSEQPRKITFSKPYELSDFWAEHPYAFFESELDKTVYPYSGPYIPRKVRRNRHTVRCVFTDTHQIFS